MGAKRVVASRHSVARPRIPVKAIAHIALVAVALLASSLRAQTVDPNLWVTNGQVRAIARDGNTIYIGGDFTRVGPATGACVAVDASTGVPVPPFPKVVGAVLAVAPDGSGGWYIGGSFSTVQGQPRNNVAHLDATGHVTAWDPNSNSAIHALAVHGATVYVAGSFTEIGMQPRNYIAALDATTGSPTAWDPNANYAVLALAVRGATVYAGGYFTTIGGQARGRIAALDAATGSATAWDANANNYVNALAVSGDIIYAGGRFTSIGGQTRNCLAVLDASTGNATAWNPNLTSFEGDPIVSLLAVSGGIVYVGGSFLTIDGQIRRHVAALDTTTGSPTAWDPNPGGGGGVSALAVNGNTVYVGGYFNSIGGQLRTNVAALDAATGSATAWDPGAHMMYGYGSGVTALAVSGGVVYVGGSGVTSIGGLARSGTAALDASTGRATAWNPNASGGNYTTVNALAVSGGVVYAGGQFTGIGGQARDCIAALDAVTGAATGWNPNVGNGANLAAVHALAVSGGTIYAGGEFTSIGGMARNYVAALDAVTGSAVAWDPNGDGPVTALAVSGDIVYAGGAFTSIGGQVRSGFAALDAATGSATDWDPDADVIFGVWGVPYALAVSGSTVYAGGPFGSIGGQARNFIAALDAATGGATPWDPNAGGCCVPQFCGCQVVSALAVSGDIVYVGGRFGTIGGQERHSIAALDAATGTATAWNPDPSGSVVALAVSGNTVYAGGDFTNIGGQPHSGIAGISEVIVGVDPQSQDLPTGRLVTAPNPFHSSLTVSFVLPRTGDVEVSVHDVHGRLVRRRRLGALPAGMHYFRWDGLDADGRASGTGVYFVQLQAPGLDLHSKVLRLK